MPSEGLCADLDVAGIVGFGEEVDPKSVQGDLLYHLHPSAMSIPFYWRDDYNDLEMVQSKSLPCYYRI